MGLAQRKRDLRAAMARRRRAVTRADAERAASQAARHLGADRAFGAAARIGVYASLADELPSGPLVATAEAAGKPLLWPRVEREGALVLARARPDELAAAAYGVPAPPEDRPAAALGPGDLVVVPGLAFDARGGRLGRGGGHYDRLLASAGEGARFVGAGYGFQCVEDVPCGPEDRPVHAILTEEGLRWLTR